MASKPDSDSETKPASGDEAPSAEALSKAEDTVGAFIKDFTGFKTKTRGGKPFKKCKSATFKVDGTCFTIGKVVFLIIVWIEMILCLTERSGVVPVLAVLVGNLSRVCGQCTAITINAHLSDENCCVESGGHIFMARVLQPNFSARKFGWALSMSACYPWVMTVFLSNLLIGLLCKRFFVVIAYTDPEIRLIGAKPKNLQRKILFFQPFPSCRFYRILPYF